jgi:hypothetical protein
MLMPRLLDKNGEIVAAHINLGWIRRHTHNAIEVCINKQTVQDNRHPFQASGILIIQFNDGSRYLADFASFTVLQGVVRRWRNLYGTSLVVNNEPCGEVEHSNPALQDE